MFVVVTVLGLVWNTTATNAVENLRVARPSDGAILLSTGLIVIYFVVPVGGWILLDAVPAVRGAGGSALSLALGYIWPVVVSVPMLSDPLRRGLHDRAAGTVVTFQPLTQSGGPGFIP